MLALATENTSSPQTCLCERKPLIQAGLSSRTSAAQPGELRMEYHALRLAFACSRPASRICVQHMGHWVPGQLVSGDLDPPLKCQFRHS